MRDMHGKGWLILKETQVPERMNEFTELEGILVWSFSWMSMRKLITL
jgi:hypothetical protein